ncbi:hypothetical protein BUY93_12020 [Mammaliicoccus fleurettii]|nr:hypothetical protein BUY93_12020 [Mammaliicoccus fleurettii]
MNNVDISKEELERLNKENEDELREYDFKKEKKQEKKQFFTLKFMCTFFLVILMVSSLVRLFI